MNEKPSQKLYSDGILESSVVLKVEVLTLNRKIAKQIQVLSYTRISGADVYDKISKAVNLGWVARDAVEEGSFTAELHQLPDGTLWFVPVDFTRVTGPQIFVA